MEQTERQTIESITQRAQRAIDALIAGTPLENEQLMHGLLAFAQLPFAPQFIRDFARSNFLAVMHDIGQLPENQIKAKIMELKTILEWVLNGESQSSD